MIKAWCCAAAAALVLFGAMVPADAAKKRAAKSGLTAVQLECFKQYGAWYDAASKQWKIEVPYYHVGSKMDAIENCVAQRTGKRPAKFISERRG